jgi:type IV pilus assembly protein PilM
LFAGLTESLLPIKQRLLKPLQRQRLALAIGDATLGLLAYAAKGDAVVLENFLEVPLPAGVCREGVPQLPEALGDLIGDLLLQNGLPAPGALALVPSPAVQMRYLQLPKGALHAELVELLAAQEHLLQLPFPLAQAEWCVQRRGEGWLAAFMASSSIDRWIQTFNAAGMDLHRLQPACLCVEPLLPKPLSPSSSDSWCGNLHLTERQWQLILWAGNAPQLLRQFEPGDGLSWLTGQLQQRQLHLQQLWLTGPGASEPQLWQSWEQRLGCACEALDPFANSRLRLAPEWLPPAPSGQLDQLIGAALVEWEP